jgi:hypothetical protein
MAEATVIKAESDEIELLIQQAKIEAGRHETRRSAAVEKLNLAADRLNAGAAGTPKDVAELANQLVSVSRRAALMEAQIDLLEGKRKSAARLHEALASWAGEVAAMAGLSAADLAAGAGGAAGEMAALAGAVPPGAGHIVLAAQEDLRREIARQMHDGPAQSLTNIVLQAQIVEHLLDREPEKAATEVHQLIAMVQRTLDATKTFIFDVRPMVLDDLGLVPTLRRASRDRGRRAGVTVDFESIGVDRRLPVDLESGLFRILDQALTAQIAGKPDTLSLHLDWGEALRIDLTAGRKPQVVPDPELPPEGTNMPPALAEMVEERRRAHREAVEAARLASLARLPELLWREVSGRAKSLGFTAELLDEGARLKLVVELPDAPAPTAAAAEAATPAGGV